jgi:penicillin-binding protein-related factor A (putative recombinase)
MGYDPRIFQRTGRAAGGLRAKQAGDQLESLIYSSQSDHLGPIVRLVRIQMGARFIKDQRGELDMIRQKSAFDYAGAVCKCGVGVFFDAKSVADGASLAVNNPKIVKPQQIAHLEDVGSTGAIAGLLVRNLRGHEFLWLPSTRLRSLKPIRWDDACWLRLGNDSALVPFRSLIEFYGITVAGR